MALPSSDEDAIALGLKYAADLARTSPIRRLVLTQGVDGISNTVHRVGISNTVHPVVAGTPPPRLAGAPPLRGGSSSLYLLRICFLQKNPTFLTGVRYSQLSAPARVRRAGLRHALASMTAARPPRAEGYTLSRCHRGLLPCHPSTPVRCNIASCCTPWPVARRSAAACQPWQQPRWPRPPQARAPRGDGCCDGHHGVSCPMGQLGSSDA